MPIYIAGQPNPISGNGVSYTREGKRCSGQNCGPLKVTTDVRTYCSTSGKSSKASCKNYTALAIRFKIIDTQNNQQLASDVVEMIPEARVNENLILTCPAGQYLKGISLKGTASCASIGFTNTASPNVERKTCFKKQKVQQPKQGGAEGEMEEVEVEVRDDSSFMQSIDGSGKIICKPKTW